MEEYKVYVYVWMHTLGCYKKFELSTLWKEPDKMLPGSCKYCGNTFEWVEPALKNGFSASDIPSCSHCREVVELVEAQLLDQAKGVTWGATKSMSPWRFPKGDTNE